MIISVDEILNRNIVKNRDYAAGDGLVDPEGAALDVRVGEIWRMVPETKAFLHKKTRQTRQYIKMATFNPKKDETFVIEPNTCYQFKTVEILDLPSDMVARFNPRYNLWINGIFVHPSKADPGYSGNIGVPVFNLSGVPFEIELGARFGQFEFHMVQGKTYTYRGQWKGDRLFIDEEELQV